MRSEKEFNKYQLRSIIRHNPGITSSELLYTLTEYKMVGNWYQQKISRLLLEMENIDKNIKSTRIGNYTGGYQVRYYIT